MGQHSGTLRTTIIPMRNNGRAANIINPDPPTEEQRMSIVWIRVDRRLVSASCSRGARHWRATDDIAHHEFRCHRRVLDPEIRRVYSSTTIVEPIILGRPMVKDEVYGRHGDIQHGVQHFIRCATAYVPVPGPRTSASGHPLGVV